PSSPPLPRYAIAMYYTQMTKNTLGQIVTNQFELDPEQLYSIEGSYVFQENTWVYQFFHHIVDRVDANLNFTVHHYYNKNSFEWVAFLAFRWTEFPWNDYLRTNLCVGEGISRISRVTRRERLNSDDVQKFINYLSFEAAFALPSHPFFEVFARMHHRSGVFGLYGAKNCGSTAIGAGIRWLFP
ncbi:MAG: hypothetical protein KDH94_07580, partial [Coxiellaceae bacterium]|nr:hypothetical protein [Coxiellaceae bacterium]